MQLHVNAAPIICRDKHTSILKYGHIDLTFILVDMHVARNFFIQFC